MKRLLIYIFVLISASGIAQKSIAKLLEKHNTNSVPYISPQELAMPKTKAILLDTREVKEYNTSHIEDAICVGYDFFNLDTIQKQFPKKDIQIVVYCSLGIRSEDIAEQLKTNGYTNVFNLYGGIFEWKNNHLEVVNSKEKKTDSIHAFSPTWGKWLKNGIKIYD